jgi:hypothetical protein
VLPARGSLALRTKSEVKTGKKIFHTNENQKDAKVTVQILNKIAFGFKTVTEAMKIINDKKVN